MKKPHLSGGFLLGIFTWTVAVKGESYFLPPFRQYAETFSIPLCYNRIDYRNFGERREIHGLYPQAGEELYHPHPFD